jgi:hypothetical protein
VPSDRRVDHDRVEARLGRDGRVVGRGDADQPHRPARRRGELGEVLAGAGSPRVRAERGDVGQVGEVEREGGHVEGHEPADLGHQLAHLARREHGDAVGVAVGDVRGVDQRQGAVGGGGGPVPAAHERVRAGAIEQLGAGIRIDDVVEGTGDQRPAGQGGEIGVRGGGHARPPRYQGARSPPASTT